MDATTALEHVFGKKIIRNEVNQKIAYFNQWKLEIFHNTNEINKFEK